ncbi:helix-turn-helix domain-containing protein [Bacteroides ovatus]|uniref:helix-turn-helix domain-containing protein n=1 Tax=Bacteroides ovatus TaxID=28116 RepID=UPI001F21D0E0|nr:helix-turn-helix domain-containing protein [Bacteroides ovatus]MCE8921499.1 helix-turn-helix domain-containing protein [Bacteroides ovatus]
MDILDNKSPQIGSFFTVLNELSDTIQEALQNRTPHLNGEKYLTNREVCQLLRISSRTLQNWRDTGKIKFIRLNGKILYRANDLKID